MHGTGGGGGVEGGGRERHAPRPRSLRQRHTRQALATLWSDAHACHAKPRSTMLPERPWPPTAPATQPRTAYLAATRRRGRWRRTRRTHRVHARHLSKAWSKYILHAFCVDFACILHAFCSMRSCCARRRTPGIDTSSDKTMPPPPFLDACRRMKRDDELGVAGLQTDTTTHHHTRAHHSMHVRSSIQSPVRPLPSPPLCHSPAA